MHLATIKNCKKVTFDEYGYGLIKYVGTIDIQVDLDRCVFDPTHVNANLSFISAKGSRKPIRVKLPDMFDSCRTMDEVKIKCDMLGRRCG